MVTSVDVTAPDGGETWSLCFDRNVIGDVADYIVFMAYDQYGASSNKSGTTAGYNWVELSLKKFLNTEEIESNKNDLSDKKPVVDYRIDGNSAGKCTLAFIYHGHFQAKQQQREKDDCLMKVVKKDVIDGKTGKGVQQ